MTVLNAGERQVRDGHERQRPTLDAATMALWESWFSREFQKHVAPYIKKINDVTAANAEAHNKLIETNKKAAAAVKHVADENATLRREVSQLRKDLINKGIIKITQTASTVTPLPEWLRKQKA